MIRQPRNSESRVRRRIKGGGAVSHSWSRCFGITTFLGLLWPIGVGAQTYSRTEAIEYHDNTSLWVIGQVKKTTCLASLPANSACDGQPDSVMSETTYDTGFALPQVSRKFNKIVQTLSYETVAAVASGQRGTVKTVADGNGNITTANQWKRGLPQQILYPATNEAPSGTTVSSVVNDQGWITAVTDENGFRHCYDYDAVGRITKIRYPSETTANACDPGDGSGAWLATTIAFTKSAISKYGLPAGHWQQVVATGAGRKIIYLDALWRPVVTEEFDATSGTTAGATRDSVCNDMTGLAGWHLSRIRCRA